MVVDDDPDMRRALTACLDAEGYEVELCEHGRDALERLELGSRPDVIVLDLMMPVLNGLELRTSASTARSRSRSSLKTCSRRSRPDQGACGLQELAASDDTCLVKRRRAVCRRVQV